MEEAFAYVVVAVTVVGAIVGVLTLGLRARAYDEIGRSVLPPEPPPAPDAALEVEVRELVIARNERRARQGKPPLDVEAEVRRTLEGLR